MREKPSIPEEQLRVCLEERYGMSRVTLDFLPLGLDTRSGLYHVVSDEGTSYFVRVKSGPLYEPSCVVPRVLWDRGIESVVPPLFNRSNALWARLHDWTVTVYSFLDGDTGWAGMTSEHWKATGVTLKRIHEAELPNEVLESLRKETFDPAEYVRLVADFESRHVFVPRHASERGHHAKRELCGSWMAHRPAIQSTVTALQRLAAELRERAFPQVICHADLHPGNLLRDRAGRVFVIDWEDVMIAPKERDFIFVEQKPARGSVSENIASEDIAPFFQGYGHTEVDREALAYYRHERIVQDLIECARNVFLRNDLGEATKSESAQLFDRILTERELSL